MWFPSVDRALDVVPQYGPHPANKINERKINEILNAMKLKGESIEELGRRVNDLEHSRKRKIIVTGLNVPSYAHAA